MRRSAVVPVAVLLAAVAVVCTFMVACGSSSPKQQTQLATVNVSMSDPPTCGSAQGGQFARIYVSVRDVQINASASAGDNDPGWIDLTPSLKNAPMQVDLLGIANSSCFLAVLGSNTQIQPGSYQQIRVLLDNTSVITNNACIGVGNNCVFLNSSPTQARPLELSSEVQTGIKIPPGQIAGGQFAVAAGETKDLNIDFNACASIVQQGNGRFRLKPALHAGEITLTSPSISGTVVNGVNSQPISGKVVVALEQKDATGTDRVVMETVPDSLGHFVFCPLPAGTYDVVVAGVDHAGNAFAATVTTGLQPGNAAGNIPLFAPSGVNQTAATITGTLTSSTGSAAAAADAAVTALQQAGSTMVTIPVASLSASTVLVSTVADQSCSAQTDCGTYSVLVPAANPTIGAFVASGTTYAQNTSATLPYTIDAQASMPSSGGKAFCTPPELTTNKLVDGVSPLNVTAGTTSPAATLAFTGCQ